LLLRVEVLKNLAKEKIDIEHGGSRANWQTKHSHIKQRMRLWKHIYVTSAGFIIMATPKDLPNLECKDISINTCIRNIEMPLLIDMSQISLSNLFAIIRPGQPIEEDLIRHMVLNSIRSYKQKFEEKYGRLILCIDSRHYWRKDVFPHYKFKRKEDRDKSGFDWDTIWDCMHKVRDELQTYMPYQVLEINGAEADDIIGVLTKNLHKTQKVLIISGDKDFPQLQKYPNVSQFSPLEKEWKKSEDPIKFLKSHIMKGDIGDSIPNFLTPDDFFVTKKPGDKQKQIRNDKLDLWCSIPKESFCTQEMLHGWSRNETLVDLSKIPGSLEKSIMSAYNSTYNSDNSKIMDYFMKKRLKTLMGNIREFYVNKKENLLERAEKL
jgi:hypothetical protein